MNIDFEYQLFDPQWSLSNSKFQKMCMELEWVFFFMGQNGDVLSTDKKYSDSYIEFCEKITGNKISLTAFNKDSIPYWGEINDIEFEKKVNSKITSFEIARTLNLLPENSLICKSQKDLRAINLDNKILKSPFEFSGRGFYFNSAYKGGFPVIIEPFETRIEDFGIRIDLNTLQMRGIQNFVTKQGQFKGGKVVTEEELEKKFDKNILLSICNEYKNLGVKDFIQIDCYSTANEMRYLVEMNHRKTMGDFIVNIEETLKWNSLGVLLLNEKESKQFLKSNKSEYLTLSPAGNMFNCLAVDGVSNECIEELMG
ncbi:MAG: hypothetical protein KC493_09200 [Bacteriovoracaceae bacterium]|nr:hypothetical protein [Bacteriovoracaceae bacterium]